MPEAVIDVRPMTLSTRLLVPLLFAAASTGCASLHSRFNSVYPGMSSASVVETMKSGPSRAKEFSDGSTAWYYGEDLCMLMREDKVVAKERTLEKTKVDAVVVALQDSEKAMCAPPGMAETRREQSIRTPVGTFKGTIDPEAIKNKVIETKNELVGDSPK